MKRTFNFIEDRYDLSVDTVEPSYILERIIYWVDVPSFKPISIRFDLVVCRDEQGGVWEDRLVINKDSLIYLVCHEMFGDQFLWNDEIREIIDQIDLCSIGTEWEWNQGEISYFFYPFSSFSDLLPQDCVHDVSNEEAKANGGIDYKVDWERIDWFGKDNPGQRCLGDVELILTGVVAECFSRWKRPDLIRNVPDEENTEE